MLYDDARRLAERALAAGVDVTTYFIDDSVHVFPLFAFLPEATDAIARIARWARPLTETGTRPR